jgi:DNA-binding MarR family transcriptional regulator
MLPSPCLCTNLRRAARSVSKRYDDALACVGLNVAQFGLLNHLARLEDPSITELAQALGLDRSTLGRNLQVLQTDGLVLLAAGKDQRHRIVRMTEEGRRRWQSARERWQGAQAQLVEAFGEDRRAALLDLLDALQRLE